MERVELTTETAEAAERVRGWLGMWRDDAGATPGDWSAVLHIYGEDGHEIGNAPLDDSPSRVVAGWALRAGEQVVQVSPPVVVGGVSGTNHYGVMVREG